MKDLKCINKREYKKLKKECINYNTTKKILTTCVKGDIVINFDMFQDLMELMTYYRIKEEIKD